jgi:hypothetical protein
VLLTYVVGARTPPICTAVLLVNPLPVTVMVAAVAPAVMLLGLIELTTSEGVVCVEPPELLEPEFDPPVEQPAESSTAMDITAAEKNLIVMEWVV